MAEQNQIEYPKQTSEWGRQLIDILNIHEIKVQQQIQSINDHFDKKFETFQSNIDEIKTSVDAVRVIAEKNEQDIADIRKDIRAEVNYLRFTCEQLTTENKTLKQKTTNLENYSRRNNVVIKGIKEEKSETKEMCEEKARHFFIKELKMEESSVKRMKFIRVHRLGGFQQRRSTGIQFCRPIIIRFQNYADKSVVWGSRSNISSESLFMSENFSAETEFNRKKLFIVYRYAKSLDRYKGKISLNGDILIIDSVRYTVDNLCDLPVDLSPRKFCEKSNDTCLVFGGIISEHCPFSNWYPCDIRYNDHIFHSLEQAYQYSKAIHCDDKTIANKLLYTTNPRSAKDLGSKVQGLDQSDWDQQKTEIMSELVKIKFEIPVLKTELLKTGQKLLVESGTDKHYAAGLQFTSKDIFTQNKWSGKNKLGVILCDVRKYILDNS